jgi:hypothetical protein
MPDLAYSSVGTVSIFMEYPKLSHLAATKRILMYIRGTLDNGILFPATNEGSSYNLVSYTGSNWCGKKDDRKSTVGYIFMIIGAPISWCSRKELVVESIFM